MAVYRGPVCKLCRREGVKLFLKGDRCLSAKCSLEKKEYPPGQHGQGRIRKSEFGKQLREKQKVKRSVLMTEKQFRIFFKEADSEEGPTGANLLIKLETRLDNVVQRLKFGASIKQARQLVLHRHIEVNSAICNIPSYTVKEGDKISIRKKSREINLIKDNLEENEDAVLPEWIERDSSKISGKVLRKPTREEVTLVGGDIEENLIVELYSK
ncbi:MAG: 30S ribosomal protein S4 [Elusimicrobia bacterium]|jgi:small subunit ribosomal protein S4|nr:30S ribosomal protein S4 [Elusimicrobiota bacterium]